jgi:hypothetical protein
MMTDFWWLSVVGAAIGAGALLILLYMASKAKTPDQFSALPMYMFFCLTALAGSLILAIIFFPENLSGTVITVSRMLQSNNGTQWVINIGGVNQVDTLGIQIPIFILVLGTLGSYVRYLYLGIPEVKSRFKKSFRGYQKIYGKNADQIEWIDDILKNIPEPDPEFRSFSDAYERERKGYTLKMQKLKGAIEEKRFELSFEVVNDFLRTAGLFLLGPLLAIMAWLILQISGTQTNWVFAATSLTVGFTASSIIRRARSIVEERISDSEKEEKEKEPVISLDKDLERVGKTVAITGSSFKEDSDVTVLLADNDVAEPAEITTNAKGAFSAKFKVPEIEPGEYELTVEDEEGNGASATFTVIAASLSLDKAQEKAGATIIATGSNFAADAAITLTYDNQELATEPTEVNADGDGSFSTKFKVPKSTVGEHKVTATDEEGNSASATFTVSQ